VQIFNKTVQFAMIM